MIDEKKIEKAAKAICFDDKMTYDSYCKIEGFRKGVEWAINEFLKDLWHPASEKPDKFNHYGFAALYIMQNDHHIRLVLYDKDNMSWKNVISIAEYWLYIDDLLPKEGGEQ